MATDAYNTFLDRPSKEVVTIVEVAPKQLVQGWSLVAGRTNTYSNTFENFVGTEVVQGGLYRKFLGLNQNSVGLSQQASIADVEANAGSWYYDEKPLGQDSTLYAHTTSGVDPDLFSAMVSKFRVHFASVPKIFDDIYYEPRVTTESLPDVHEETEDLFFGPVKKVASGEITINNADGLFDKLSVLWSWKNAAVSLFLGGDDLDHTPGGGGDYVEIGKFLNENLAPGLREATLFVRDAQKVTFRRFPITPMFEDNYPNIDDSLRGTRIPLLFGAKTNITPVLIDNTVQNGEYMIADPAFQTLYSIDIVYNDGAEIPGGNLQKSLSGCTFTVLSTYTTPIGVVTCNAKGQPVRSKSWETSTDYLKFYGEIVSEIYTHYLGLEDSDIDSAAALSVDATEPAAQAAYITQDRTARAYIRGFEVGVLGRTVRTTMGKISPTLWFPGFNIDTAKTIEDPDIVEFQPDPRIETIFSRVFVFGDRDPTDASFNITVERTDSEAQYLHLDGRTEDRSIETFLLSSVDAALVADRIRFVSKNPDILVTMVETGIRLMDTGLGDRHLVTFNRAPSPTGAWESKPVEVTAVTRRFSPHPSVELQLNDLKGVGPFIGIWVSDLAPNHASATEAQKLQSGFWTDDSGFPDPTDQASADTSLWW